MTFSKDLDNILDDYIKYIDLFQKINYKISTYEKYGVETPENIKIIFKKWNAAANIIIINSECIAISNVYNISEKYLYKIFFSKCIFKVIHETFALLKNYNKILFKNEEHPNESKILKKTIKDFKKKYDENYIENVRNKTSSHYTEDFQEHIEVTKAINITKTGEMFIAFLVIMNELALYVVTYVIKIVQQLEEITEYFKYAEAKLQTLSDI